jgi:hypothetical protein
LTIANSAERYGMYIQYFETLAQPLNINGLCVDFIYLMFVYNEQIEGVRP